MLGPVRTFLILMLFAGCGEVAVQSDSGVQDAASDGAIDAVSIDAVSIDADLTGTANVVTLAHLDHQGAGPLTGQPAGNIDVVSLRPDGSVAGTIKTNGAGQASIPVYPGGTVTAIYPRGDGAGAELVTFADVKPGDTLTFGREVQNQASTEVGQITVTLPSLMGASYYYVLNDCNYSYVSPNTTGGGATARLVDYTSCHGSNNQVVLALALDSSGTLKASMSMPITYVNNTTYTFGNNWVTAPTASLTVSGLSPEIYYVNFNLATALYKTPFQAVTGGSPMGNAISAMAPFPPVGPRALAQVDLVRSGSFGPTILFSALPTNDLKLTVNAPALPPWLSAAVIKPALGGAAWFPVGGAGSSGLPSSHDAVVGQMNYGRNDGPNYLNFSWTFIIPPTETEFKLPVLPAPFESLQPRVNDGSTYSNTLTLLEVPSVDGYDDARALPESSLACPRCAVRDGILPRAAVSYSPGGATVSYSPGGMF